MSMLVANHKRPGELWFGAATMGFGFWIVLPPVSMASPGYARMLDIAPEASWGTMFFMAGLAHMLSVMANGSRWWSPLTRSITALMMAVAYLAMCLAMRESFPFSTAVYTYGLAAAGGLWCWYHAVMDSGAAVRKWVESYDAS